MKFEVEITFQRGIRVQIIDIHFQFWDISTIRLVIEYLIALIKTYQYI